MLSMLIFVSISLYFNDNVNSGMKMIILISSGIMVPYLIIMFLYTKNLKPAIFRIEHNKIYFIIKHGDDVTIDKDQIQSFEPINIPMIDNAYRLSYKEYYNIDLKVIITFPAPIDKNYQMSEEFVYFMLRKVKNQRK